MLKFLNSDSLTFDTETVPDVEAGARLLGRSLLCGFCGGSGENPVSEKPCICEDGGVPELDMMEAMWRAHADYDAETNPRPFLKPILTKVVSIATVRRHRRADGFKVDLKVIERPTEAAMVRAFLDGVGQLKPQLVGFNSEGFDLPLLIQRALVHGLSVPEFCKRPGKPWEGIDYHAKYSDWHVDLMHELGGFGRSVPSLSEACAALNILGGAKDVTGADVLDLYLAGDLATINAYCAKDAVRHFLILLRLCVLAGHVSAGEAAREEADVCQQLDAYSSAPVAAGAGA